MRRKVADLAACSPVELLARSEKLVEPLDSVAGSRRRDKLAVAPVLHDGAPRRSNLRRWLVAVVRVVGLVEPHEKRPVHCRRDWCVHSDRVKAPVRASDTHTHTHTHTHRARGERGPGRVKAPVHGGEPLVDPPELGSLRTVADAFIWLPVPAPDNMQRIS